MPRNIPSGGSGGSSTGPPYVNADVLASGQSLIIDGRESSTGKAVVHEIFGDADAKIYKEVDQNNDGSYEVSVLIDASTGRFHSQLNQMQVSEEDNIRLRIQNNHDSEGQFGASGVEVTE